MKPRIGLVVPGLELGGGVPAVARFIRNTITRDGHFEARTVSLATAADDPDNVNLAAPRTWLRGIRTARGTWESSPCVHVGAFAGELEFQRYRPRAALDRVLADCDLIQVVSGYPAWANAVLDLDKPVALQVATRARVERRWRDGVPGGRAGGWRKRMTSITDRLDDRAMRRVDAIQVENPWMLDHARSITAGLGTDVRHAPPGVDSTRFRPDPAVDRLHEPCILYVGRCGDPRKNIGLLLEAFSMLPETVRQRVRLLLAGPDAPPASFLERADALHVRDRITHVAAPDDDTLLGLFQRASVFALPSDEEGFGVVVVEAMACGVPVVATRSGGPDGIITDGADGYLVPRDDAGEMSMRLLGLVTDPVRNAAMGAAARRTVEAHYDEAIAGAVYLDMWDRMAHKAGAA